MKDKYRKALKNYTTRVTGLSMINAIQQILVDFGASGIGYSYNNKQGKIEGIHFKIDLSAGNSKVVNLPLRTANVTQVLKGQNQYKNEEHSYRVALANIRDWLDAQLALLSTEMVEFPQIFLPYMVDPQTGKTLYETLSSSNFLLPAPPIEQ